MNAVNDAVVPGVYISPTFVNTQHTLLAESNTAFNIDSFILLTDDATVVPPESQDEDGSEGVDEDQDPIFDDDVDDDQNTDNVVEESQTNEIDGNGNGDGNKKKPLGIGAIIGIVVAIVVVIAVAAVVAFILIKKKKESNSSKLLTSTTTIPGFEI